MQKKKLNYTKEEAQQRRCLKTKLNISITTKP
jgi:hypothetical protein